jgi:uncharacterized protein
MAHAYPQKFVNSTVTCNGVLNMQMNILWTGIEYHSLENCILTIGDKGAEINSSVIGAYANQLYSIAYRIRTNQYWETTFCEITSQLHNTVERTDLRREGKESWYVNGQPDDASSTKIHQAFTN